MNRRAFVQGTGMLALSPLLPSLLLASPAAAALPVVRPAAGRRHFQSQAVEAAIGEFQRHVKDPELGWLFANCFPNPLDTTVTPGTRAGRPDTYVGTGDSDAMGLRDSTAQVWPYLPFVKQDAALRQLVAGVINRHTQCILRDPYASAFYHDLARVGEWQPGVHARKWAVDSLCYPIRLGYHYWKTTGDDQPFDADWRRAIALTVSTFREQQRQTGPYRYQRPALSAADTQPLGGYGYPARPVGLLASAFWPGGEATRLPFVVPSNFLAVSTLRQAFLMLADIAHDGPEAQECLALSDEIAVALRQHAVVTHPQFGPVYAYEADGCGGHSLLDEASVPGLLALPYLGATPLNEPTYQNTRRLVLSAANPFFYKGSAGEGIGSPRSGPDQIWPLSIIMRGLTSTDDAEIRACVQQLRATHAGTGYLPESFYKNDPGRLTRAQSPETNVLFSEFLWRMYQERPHLLT
ncbi:glycoside hydrolase family 125 protein [Hymenobacter sp. H14-R3]|uniref:glycoside hydrolase family 125 protein n=1 Tax=Hymenobacter sp. H14-R3 TaxID=3046308 RepID=UPI0024B9E01F|nr:glycoside hydrolase family 125 protein [Hymenobacter sp. H14-R3]MDJ0367269.1 glycoside hydrolase family 125 protein [Hymenobacter sp. H14-R3]